MMRKNLTKEATFDTVLGAFIGVVVFGIVRLVVAAAGDFAFFYISETIPAATIVGAIIIPIGAIVLCTQAKRRMGQNPKVLLALRFGILACAIASLLIALFGMSYYRTEGGNVYSYTVFDAFVNDLEHLIDGEDMTLYMQSLIDDIFSLMIFVMILLTLIQIPRIKVGTPGTTATVQSPGPLLVAKTAPVETSNFCGSCGAPKLHPVQRFCETCGAAHSPEPAVQSAVNPEVTVPASVSASLPPETSIAPPATSPPPISPATSAPPPAGTATPPTSQPRRPTAKGDFTKFRDALVRTEHKLEDLAGKVYQRIFKKTPTQRTNRICIGVVALVITTSIILGISLTPARQITGIWKTSTPVRFNIEQVGGSSLGYDLRDMTWKISPLADPNQVLIEVTYTYEDHTSGYIREVPDLDFFGTISSSHLEVRYGGSLFPRSSGSYDFTTDIITGTWDDTDSVNQRVYTTTKGLTLTKISPFY